MSTTELLVASIPLTLFGTGVGVIAMATTAWITWDIKYLDYPYIHIACRAGAAAGFLLWLAAVMIVTSGGRR